MLNYGALFLALLFLIFGGFSYWKSRQLKLDLENKRKEMDRRMYELAILKELGDRVGYSLNVQKIVDIITGSLKQFIDYAVVSYMLLDADKIVFKAHLEGSVSRKFINVVRDRMLKSLSALLDREFGKNQVDETLSGAILVEELESEPRSFFNIPLVIGEKVVGVLTVAHVQEGLYKEDDMTILYKITNQASNAVTRLQEVVETEQRKLNAMVESMTEGVIMTDNDFRLVVVNPAIKNALGLESKKNLTIFDLIDNLEGKFDIRGKLEESVKLDKILVSEEVVIRNRFYQIVVSPVKRAHKLERVAILGGVVIFHDVTHEKEVEKMRDDFTSMMVHELRSPLDGVKKITELLQLGGKKINKQKTAEYTQMIRDASSQMLGLVNDLLDVAKLEAGKFQISKEFADIRTLIAERVNFYATSAAEFKVGLTSQFGENIPEKFKFDAARLSQVLNNLISNALKFTAVGGKVTVQILFLAKDNSIAEAAQKAGIEWQISGSEPTLANLPDSLLVAVTDTGVGIARENISKLFNKFKQFGEAKEAEGKKGTGLGLVVAKGIVEAHGGLIGVASKEGIGTTFYFTIPAVEYSPALQK